jgi:hypothetical protein
VQPRIRAAQTQSLLHTVRRLPPPVQRDILGRIGPRAVEEIESNLPVVWVPMELHMDLSDAIRDVVGPERNVELWRETMAEAFQRPLLRGFVAMATSLFGVTPFSLLRKGANIYEHITRDVGHLQFELTGPTEGLVYLHEFPAKRFRFVCYIEGLQGCLLAGLDIAGRHGVVSVASHDDLRGDVKYRLRWEENA